METMRHSNISILIDLLEDPSTVVYHQVHKTIASMGIETIPKLRGALDTSTNGLQIKRIKTLLSKLKVQKLGHDLRLWKKSRKDDLLEGLLLIAKYGDPYLDRTKIDETLDAIEAMVRHKIQGKTNLETTFILNRTILFDFGFNGDHHYYSNLDAIFLHKIIETETASPLGLSLLYLLIAERLNIPLVGIDAAGYFMLGYADDTMLKNDTMPYVPADKVIFYIDPFQSGYITSAEDFDMAFSVLPSILRNSRPLTVTTTDIIKYVLNDLIFALFSKGEREEANTLITINETL